MFGVHRLYLKSRWSLVFIVLVVALLEVNTIARGARDVHSEASNAVTIAEFNVKRAQRSLQKGRRGAGQQLATANEGLKKARQDLKDAEIRLKQKYDDWEKKQKADEEEKKKARQGGNIKTPVRPSTKQSTGTRASNGSKPASQGSTGKSNLSSSSENARKK